ncbi:MAG: CPBP family intramembrane metalloprotease [Ruminococcus sp.]|nr:CPBP family intramembrane metalloprotease [Ruminococcus sp.]
MSENITPEHYRAEIAALNSEIYRLSRPAPLHTIDPYDPFDNPTEYHGFRSDYSSVLPEMTAPHAEISLEPDDSERRRLRRSYSIGGWCLLLQFAAVDVLIYGLLLLFRAVLMKINPGWDSLDAYYYLRGTSMMIGISLIVYAFSNIFTAMLGLKWSRTDVSELTRTRELTFGRVVAYCLIGIMLRNVAVYASAGVEAIADKFGYTTHTLDTGGLAESVLGQAVMLAYTCIVAPVTEELFFRGMLLRTFSKANQRFAVFASAVFFGLVHGNIPQFLLAFILGVFLAHITLRHGSVIPSIIVHSFINSFSSLYAFLVGKLDDSAYLVLALAMLLLNTTGFLVLLFFRAENKIPATTPAQSRRGLPVAAMSVPLAAAFVLLAGKMILELFGVTLL